MTEEDLAPTVDVFGASFPCCFAGPLGGGLCCPYMPHGVGRVCRKQYGHYLPSQVTFRAESRCTTFYRVIFTKLIYVVLSHGEACCDVTVAHLGT